MKKFLLAALIIAGLAYAGHAISTNPASNVTADSANTALTIPYRDSNGAFAMGALTATTITLTGPGSFSVGLATQAVGGAGAAVTAVCNTGYTALGGGCDCSGAVAETSNTSKPNSATAGADPTGWTCQVSGGTGGACTAYAVCGNIN